MKQNILFHAVLSYRYLKIILLTPSKLKSGPVTNQSLGQSIILRLYPAVLDTFDKSQPMNLCFMYISFILFFLTVACTKRQTVYNSKIKCIKFLE